MGMTIQQAIAEAILAEKTAENLYRGLQSNFSTEPQVASFWNLFATEEASHIEWLKNLSGRLSKNNLDKLVDTQTQDLIYQVRLLSSEKLLSGIHDLADAFEAVNDLENGETNAVFRFLIDNFEVDNNIRDFVMAQLTTHISRLSTNLPLEYRNIMSRQAIKAL